MDQKGYIIDQKGPKIYKERQKMEFSDLNTCFLAGFSLAELGGTPLPPLIENHPAQKLLAERGGTPTTP